MSCPPLSSTQGQDEYGVLHSRNIKEVSFGQFTFDTWYGNGAYFVGARSGQLGTEASSVPRKRGSLPSNPGFWLERLYVCEFCFKYSSDGAKMALHSSSCSHNQPFPPLGTLVYADTRSKRLIKKVRGFRNELFCQNLCLFGKLFLDDKSIYYNVEAYDYYILYGESKQHSESELLDTKLVYRPMGFFSKEVTAWEPDNNLACICVFPPYQRLHLGSLLIEFLYAAAEAAGQLPLGPEFPLSPYGKQLYLRYWGKRIAFELFNTFKNTDFITLGDLAVATGFRREDLLFAFENMALLSTIDHTSSEQADDNSMTKHSRNDTDRSKGNFFYLPFSRLQKLDNESEKSKRDDTVPDVKFLILMAILQQWCEKNLVNTQILSTMLDKRFLLI